MTHRDVLERLTTMVAQRGLRPGDRLPAERPLAELLHVSRNTLRNTLRRLEAQGIVSTRRGSGTYLNIRLANPLHASSGGVTMGIRAVAEQLEAAYLLLPTLAAQCCTSISSDQLDVLQHSNIALSRSMLSDEPGKVWANGMNFFRSMAEGTDNTCLVRMVELLCDTGNGTDALLARFTREEFEALFAGHVKVLHALRERNTLRAASRVQEHILLLAATVARHSPVELTSTLREALRRREAA